MPIKRAAFKERRKAKTRHLANISVKTELKTLVKKFEKLLSAKKVDQAKEIINQLVSKIDRAASKGVIKKNTASRRISRLMKKLSSPRSPKA